MNNTAQHLFEGCVAHVPHPERIHSQGIVCDGCGCARPSAEYVLASTVDPKVKLLRETLMKCKRSHYYCEDSWYSCPAHPEGCANAAEGAECNCGANEANAEIDRVLEATA